MIWSDCWPCGILSPSTGNQHVQQIACVVTLDALRNLLDVQSRALTTTKSPIQWTPYTYRTRLVAEELPSFQHFRASFTPPPESLSSLRILPYPASQPCPDRSTESHALFKTAMVAFDPPSPPAPSAGATERTAAPSGTT